MVRVVHRPPCGPPVNHSVPAYVFNAIKQHPAQARAVALEGLLGRGANNIRGRRPDGLVAGPMDSVAALHGLRLGPHPAQARAGLPGFFTCASDGSQRPSSTACARCRAQRARRRPTSTSRAPEQIIARRFAWPDLEPWTAAIACKQFLR